MQNAGEFGLAAEEWTKFLQKFAADPKATEARYNLGVCQLQTKDYEKSIASLRDTVAQAPPQFERLEDAYLNLGSAQYSLALQNHADQFQAAAGTFGQLIEKFPDGKYHDDALFFRGEALSASGDTAEAANAYQQLLDKHADSPLRADAIYALGATLESLGKFAEADRLYDEYLAKFADREPAREVQMRKAETVMRLGNYEDAANRFAAVSQLPGFALADHALFRQAFCLSKLNQYEPAGQLFAQLVEKYPKSSYVGEATMAAARSFYRAEQMEPAEAWLVRASQVPESTNLPEIAHWRARIRLKRQQPQEALKIAQGGLAAAPDSSYAPSLKLDAADAQYEIPDQRGAAVDAYLKLVEQHPDAPIAAQALYNAAYGALQLKQFDRASELAKQFQQRFAEHRLSPDVERVLGESLMQQGKFTEAESIFGKLRSEVDEPTEQGQWTLRQLLSLYLAKKFDETIATGTQELAKLTEADQQAEAYYLIGLAHLASQRPGEAAAALQKSLEAGPQWKQRDEVMLNLAVAQNRQGQTPAAQATLAEMLKQLPDSPKRYQARHRWAEMAYANGDYERAANAYSQLLLGLGTDPPADAAELIPLALYGRGWSLNQLRKYADAIAVWNEFLQRFATHRLHSEALYGRAMAYQQSGQFTEGLTDADQLLKSLPPDAPPNRRFDVLYLRALCLSGLKQFPAAEETLQTILKEAPEYPRTDRVLYELAWGAKSRGDEESAQTRFQQLAEKFPETDLGAEALYHLGERNYANKSYGEAATLYTKAFQPHASADVREKSLYKLAWSLFQQHQYAEALGRFENLLQEFPQSKLATDARFMRGECQFQQKDYKSALNSFSEAKAIESLGESMATLALLHGAQSAGQLGQWPTSLQWLDELASRYPQSKLTGQARFERAQAKRNLGQADEALTLYAQVADDERNEVGAQARFLMGEIQFEKKQYAEAVREFQRVVLGYGGKDSPEPVQPWQARAGVEAGRCFELLASQEQDAAKKADLLRRAQQYFRYVTTQHPRSTEAQAATKQLEKYPKAEGSPGSSKSEAQ